MVANKLNFIMPSNTNKVGGAMLRQNVWRNVISKILEQAVTMRGVTDRQQLI